jgi:hypothetical protein
MRNRVPNEHGIFRRFVAALVVAIAVATLWALVIGWGTAIVASWSSSPISPTEQLVVARSGTPLIQFRPIGNNQELSYRTLDGQPAAFDGERLALPEIFPPVSKMPQLIDLPIGWGESLATIDHALPRGAWYVVRDGRPSGHAFLVGYNVATKQLIGYIGRNGFQHSLPPRDEWFDVGRGSFSSATACTGGLSADGLAGTYESVDYPGNLQRWLIFMIDGNRLVEINLRERSVREVFATSAITSIAVTEVSAHQSKEEGRPNEVEIVNQVVVRAGNDLVVLDPSTGASRKFALPESLRNESFQLYAFPDEKILLHHSDYFAVDKPSEHLFWIGADGKVTREKELRLVQNIGRSNSTNRFMDSVLANGFVPVPIFWTGMLVVVPASEYQENRQPTLIAAFNKFIGEFWPALLIAAGIGTVSAWAVWRWQRKYFRRNTKAWSAFAFLLGLPGVVAYWLEMRRAKLETCNDCQATVPRDRDACASCRAPFPAPPLLGTELFA